MRRALHELFSEVTEALWTGVLYGISITAALTVVYFALRAMGGWAAMLKAVAQ